MLFAIVLGPRIGSRHVMEEYLLNGKEARDFSGMNLVFCDTAACQRIKARDVVPYRVVSRTMAQRISDRIASAQD